MTRRLELTGATAQRWLSKGSRPVCITGLLVALLAWPFGIIVPTAGLDYSWMSGLYMAVDEGRNFGSEIVFTYGPLGFLAWPEFWFSWLLVPAVLYVSAIYLTFTITLIWILERTVGLLGAAVIAFLFLVTIPDLEWVPLLLAVGWSLTALRSDCRPAAVTLLVVGGGMLSAIEPLVKLSVGPSTLLICVLGLAGARASRRQWSAYAGITAGGFLILWFLSGQSLGNLTDYADNGAQVISGYGEAMGVVAAPIWRAAFMAAFGVGLVVVVALADLRDGRARWFGSVLTAIAVIVVFKYGVTRFQPNTVSLALSSMVAIFLMVPFPPRRKALFLIMSVVLGASALHAYSTPNRLDVVANLKQFKESAEIVVRPGLRQGRVDQTRAALQAAFALDPEILAAVQGKRVAIDPWEISIAWAYELDWSPLPVIQNYSAYTPQLDRLNAAEVENTNGPEVILRLNPGGTGALGGARSFEERHPAWDPPEQALATVCNFVPTVTTEYAQVLSRVSNRCGKPQSISSHQAEPGEAVIVPQAGPGELVLLHLKGVEIKGLTERLRLLVWRPQPRYATLNGGVATYRLVPGTSDDGLIVSRDPALDSTGPFVQLPAIKTISVTGVSRPLEFDFRSVKVGDRRRMQLSGF